MNASAELNAASYALSRHLPDMERGFTIVTNYGELAITAAEVAARPHLLMTFAAILHARIDAATSAGGVA